MKMEARMRVLAIIGSPRKGHSYRATQEIERRLTRNPDILFEYMFLSQVNLQPCHGCYVCQSAGEQYCPLKDERASLVQKMTEADGVIFVSPVYTGNVSGLMKNLMDRLAFTAHRPAFLGKPAMLLATASSSTRNTLEALAWFRYTGFEIVSKLGLPVWPSPRRQWLRGPSLERKIEKAVRRFEKALYRPPAPLSLGKVFQLYTMKASAATDPAFFRADSDYYKKIDQLTAGVPWWKKLLGRLYFHLATRWLDRHSAFHAGGSGGAFGNSPDRLVKM
jgi:NAD(P)H-dependent FMN reductase